MATPFTGGFNSSADAAFASLVESKQLLPVDSPLREVAPSALNLTSNYWAVFDLNYLATNASTENELSKVQSLAADVQALLPPLAANTSTIDIAQWWDALLRLNTTIPTLQAALDYGNANNLTAVPVADLNYSSNCNVAGAFFAAYIFPRYTYQLPYLSLVGMYRASLGLPFKQMSNWTIATIGNMTLNHNFAQGTNQGANKALVEPFDDMMQSAAIQCAPAACQNLEYSGNADMAGIGAIVAYSFIAGVSTCVAIMSIYYNTRESTPSRGEVGRVFREAVVGTSIVFWDAVVWFAVMASIASAYYLINAQSMYEYVLALLVALLMINSVGVLIVMYLYKEVEDLDNQLPRAIGQWSAYAAACCAVGISLTSNNKMDVHAIGYRDLACYAADLWPLRIAKAASSLETLLLALIVLNGLIPFLRHSAPRLFKYLDGNPPPGDKAKTTVWGFHRKLLYALGSLTLIILWIDFALIVHVRARAQAAFGISYEDNAIGYGQIVASGFAAQAVFYFLCSFALNSRVWHRASEVRASRRKYPVADESSSSTPDPALALLVVKRSP